jgi:hypothetical protein
MKNQFIKFGVFAILITGTFSCQEESEKDEILVQEAMPYQRVNANTNAQAGHVLDLYAYGMAIIKSLDCSDPASWYYQGSMHSVPKRSDISGVNVILCSSYNNGETLTAWNSCPHMYSDEKQLNFLTWHRLYVYYYERNLRYQIANGTSEYPGLGEDVANQFSIPYWDYTNQGDIPKAFISEAAVFEEQNLNFNPLYEKGRSRTLMAGLPINYEAKDSIFIALTDSTMQSICLETMNTALDYDQFLGLYNISEFSRVFEDRLHNVMHDYIGGAVDRIDTKGSIYNQIYQNSKSGFGLMGQIPSAGFDPIFFLHHSNVDRLFAARESLYGPITIEEMNQYGGSWEEVKHIYQFWDTPTNSWVRYGSMQEMLDACHSINYDYDSLPPKPKSFKPLELRVSKKQLVYERKVQHPEVLKRSGDGFKLDLSKLKAKKLANSRYTLEVDLKFGSNVFQQLAIISIPSGHDRNICELGPDNIHGINAFFGSTHDMHAGMHEEMQMKGQEFSHSLNVDLTNAIKNLPDGEELVVYMVPLNAGKEEKFFVKNLRLFEHQ